MKIYLELRGVILSKSLDWQISELVLPDFHKQQSYHHSCNNLDRWSLWALEAKTEVFPVGIANSYLCFLLSLKIWPTINLITHKIYLNNMFLNNLLYKILVLLWIGSLVCYLIYQNLALALEMWVGSWSAIHSLYSRRVMSHPVTLHNPTHPAYNVTDAWHCIRLFMKHGVFKCGYSPTNQLYSSQHSVMWKK